MVKRDVVLDYLDATLDCGSFKDYCVNGLQIEGRPRVERIAVGVSASRRFFEEAARWGADMLVVHHGLFWQNTPHPLALTGVMRNRVAFLLKHDINLAAYHLPLDAHPELGNNAQIMKHLGAEDLVSLDVGFRGRFEPPVDADTLAERVQDMLPSPPIHLRYGPAAVGRIAVVSGSGSHLVEEVAGRGADAFVTGDLAEYAPRVAEELGIHLFAMGHYNSERAGIIALGGRLHSVFDIPVRFFDIENPA